ncbi:hypothetical protein FYJ27_08550 [Anaerosalibacter bizertensis]|uniref:Uncharacterized protein n=1 Tax=Anaerosalibacter bizertensis TaxID=932217 RepID=A0A844FIM2_9FIRM|nr:hypothetical protein [Anaerosalibacter bizertensis]MSS43776.1 hypothetical protein [Anaerosalibacter bizertensis]
MSREKFEKIIEGKEYSVMQDDIDSYLSSALLQKYRGIRNVGIYDFSKLMLDKHTYINNKNKIVGVDVDFANYINIPSVSNHVLKVREGQEVNSLSVNNHITYNYYDKSLFSTTLYLYYLLAIPLPKSELGKMILLAIDSTYLSWYKYTSPYNLAINELSYYTIQNRKTLTGYLEQYGMTEMIDVLNRRTEKDFQKLQNILGIKRQIEVIEMLPGWCHFVDEKKLYQSGKWDKVLEILGLDRVEFVPVYDKVVYAEAKQCSTNFFKENRLNDSRLLSYARTGKDKVKYSLICDDVDEEIA